jgi:hypothetical protein
MTNPAGRVWENRVIAFMHEVWPDMDRDRKRGRFDKGEFVNTGHWTLECKATREIRLSEALDQAEVERKNAGAKWCAAIIKRRNHAAGKAYVVMTLDQFRALLREGA